MWVSPGFVGPCHEAPERLMYDLRATPVSDTILMVELERRILKKMF